MNAREINKKIIKERVHKIKNTPGIKDKKKFEFINSYSFPPMIKSLALEVGPKHCRMMDFLSEKGFKKVEAVDIVEEVVTIAKEKGFNAYLGDVQDLSFLTKQYSFILASHILEHIKNPSKGIKQIYNTLIPGGMLMVEVPLQRYSPKHLKNSGHFFFFETPKKLKKILVNEGFEIKKDEVYNVRGKRKNYIVLMEKK